jgi:adenosine deaminase
MQYFVDHQLPLEICPTSNVQTHVVTSYEVHPIKKYVVAGVPVTINTDNRLFSRTTLTDELWLAHQHCDLDAHQLREIALNGFRHAFLPWDEKQDVLREMTDTFPLPPSPRTPVW